MNWILATVLLVLAIALVVGGLTGHAKQIVSAITGGGLSASASSAPSTVTPAQEQALGYQGITNAGTQASNALAGVGF